jgi:hypothetical protein
MKNSARPVAGLVFVMTVLLFGGCPIPTETTPPADINWTAAADGEADTAASTAISFTFSGPVELSVNNISVTGLTGEVVTGALSGNGAAWSLALLVTMQGDVKVSINKAGIEGGSKNVAVYKVPDLITWTAGADGTAGTVTSTAIGFTFSGEVELSESDITVADGSGSAVWGALSGSGKNWSLALDAVSEAGDLTVSINKAGIESGGKAVAVYRLGETADISWTAAADGAAGIVTSTAIAIDFSGAVDLEAGDITVADGTGRAVRGALSGSGKSWSLALDSVTVQGNITLSINRAGVESGGKTVAVYRRSETPRKGTLTYTVTIPEGVVMAEESRIRIEKDGGVFTGLNTGGFSGGERLVASSITAASLELDAGWYVVDILLVAEGSGKSAGFHEDVEILEGGSVKLDFEPAAEEFISGEEEQQDLTAAITIQTPAVNEGGLKISKTGGSGANRTRELAAFNGAATVYLVALKKASQTLNAGGTDAARISKAAGPVAGETPGSGRDVFIVDTSQITAGGTMTFTITVTESGKAGITYTITLAIPSLSSLSAWFRDPATKLPRLVYRVGEEFDRSTVTVTGTYADGSKLTETLYEVEGYDSSAAGVIPIRIRKGETYATISTGSGDETSVSITILAESDARLFFPYGSRISAVDQVRGRYTVTQGRTLVIAPVLWRIPASATFQWTVDSASSGSFWTVNGEFLTFNSGTQAGDHNVTVTAYSGGTPIATASTTVECVNDSSPPSEDREYSNGGIAPGQFIDPNWGLSLGGYGGSTVFSRTFSNITGDDFRIDGNAWGAWIEPGIIWVMKDENKNGKADDTWYELKGNTEELASEIPLTRRYALTYHRSGAWENSLGEYGTLGSMQKSPLWMPDPVTFAGTRIDLSRCSTEDHYRVRGYVDTGDNLFDISDAIQVDGTPVSPPLDRIDFIMVQTGEHVYDGTFGEKSTEMPGGERALGSIWEESRSLTGESNGSGKCTYKFVNNSGYDLTISFKDVTETTSVPRSTTETITREESKLYVNYSGGNVVHSFSGNTLTFTDG